MTEAIRKHYSVTTKNAMCCARLVLYMCCACTRPAAAQLLLNSGAAAGVPENYRQSGAFRTEIQDRRDPAATAAARLFSCLLSFRRG
jgi:hypothetical protein